MADYYASARSNYFRVKNKQEFIDWCVSLELGSIFKTDEKTNDELCGFLVKSEFGSVPHCRIEGEECKDIDFLDELSTHLPDGEVAVVIEVGKEKMCYLSGFASAVNSKGETLTVSLNEIYERAKGLGDNITPAEF